MFPILKCFYEIYLCEVNKFDFFRPSVDMCVRVWIYIRWWWWYTCTYIRRMHIENSVFPPNTFPSASLRKLFRETFGKLFRGKNRLLCMLLCVLICVRAYTCLFHGISKEVSLLDSFVRNMIEIKRRKINEMNFRRGRITMRPRKKWKSFENVAIYVNTIMFLLYLIFELCEHNAIHWFKHMCLDTQRGIEDFSWSNKRISHWM